MRMVRRESYTTPAGERPVQVSAGAPGSRLQVWGEISWPERSVESLERGSNEAGRNRVNTTASSHYQPKGDWEGRAAHVTAKATDSTRKDRSVCWNSPGYEVVARFEGAVRNTRGPHRRPALGKDRTYKAHG